MSVYEPTDPYDPLAKLTGSLRALLAAGARGEAVGDALQSVRNSIADIIEQRQAQAEAERTRRRDDYDRER